ncbi:hypothetical protein ACFYT4_14460 [Streptomyces sp. NPDC004609]|uniref:hypothetical protein n=1 Tax=Streptomyces sp. NPDC004609 TaxID=3364704 RepID=UPI0036A81264
MEAGDIEPEDAEPEDAEPEDAEPGEVEPGDRSPLSGSPFDPHAAITPTQATARAAEAANTPVRATRPGPLLMRVLQIFRVCGAFQVLRVFPDIGVGQRGA